ncbi:MAG: class I SAM-dependent methyltransferase, partial [Calditrichia bacterium]
MVFKVFKTIILTTALIFPVYLAAQAHGQHSDNKTMHSNQVHSRASDSLNSRAVEADGHMRQFDFDKLVSHFENPERDKWQKPELIIEKIEALFGGKNSLRDKTVADIGAGSGYFAFRLAKKAKRVIAIDIDERFIDYIKSKNESLKLPVETRLVKPDDPELSPGEADLVMLVDTYHHIKNRPQYFRNIREKLNSPGALVIVDFKKKELSFGPPLKMKLAPSTVVMELVEAGFETIR